LGDFRSGHFSLATTPVDVFAIVGKIVKILSKQAPVTPDMCLFGSLLELRGGAKAEVLTAVNFNGNDNIPRLRLA